MKRVGIWIDHRRAVIVTIDEGRESHRTLVGDIERHSGPSGGWRMVTPYGPQVDNKEHQREERYRLHVRNFFKEVLKGIGKPDQLLVMGPADAKREFAEMVESDSALRDLKVKVEPADKMSDAQIVARVRALEME